MTIKPLFPKTRPLNQQSTARMGMSASMVKVMAYVGGQASSVAIQIGKSIFAQSLV